jgi:ELWxxDGT repeat protein
MNPTKLSLLLAFTFALGAATPAYGGWLISHYFVDSYQVERLTDINPGPADAADWAAFEAPANIAVYDGALYLSADDGVHGTELWRYDGSAAALVADINPGAKPAYPRSFAVYDGALYFAATRPDTGRELYRYDGTSVVQAADIAPGPQSSSPWGMIVAGNAMYFSAEDELNGKELWQFKDGLATLAGEVNPGPGNGVSSCCTKFANQVVFAGNGGEPWRYDGASLQLIGEINPSGNSWFLPSGRHRTVIYQNALYFMADDGVHGRELWRYDGNTIQLVQDLMPGPAWSNPGHFEVFKGELYFSASGPSGRELYRFDGKAASLAADLAIGDSSPSRLRAFDNRLYFAAGYVSWLNKELMSFNGETAELVAEINPAVDGSDVPYSSFPKGLMPLGDHLYFMARDQTYGYELWRVRSLWLMRIHAIAIDPFERFWEWPVEMRDELERDIVLATFVIDAGEPRLVQRQETNLQNLLHNPRAFGATVEPASEYGPIGVTSVVFDTTTGELLGSGTDVARSGNEKMEASLRRRVDVFTAQLSLEQLRSMAPLQDTRETDRTKP